MLTLSYSTPHIPWSRWESSTVTLFGNYGSWGTRNQNDRALSVVLRDRPQVLYIFGYLTNMRKYLGRGVPIFLGLVKTIFLRKKWIMAIFWRKKAIFKAKKDWEPKISPLDLFSY